MFCTSVMWRLFLTIWLLFSGAATAFQFPTIKFIGISTREDANEPRRLVQYGPEVTENLRLKVGKYCDVFDQEMSSDKASTNKQSASFRWEPHLQESYAVADAIFNEVERASRERCNCNKQTPNENSANALHQITLSFPSMSRPKDLEQLATVLKSDKCKELLGLEGACAELYPSSPAPYICITFSSIITQSQAEKDQKVSGTDQSESVVSATKDWVNNFLGKNRLCPYTSSVTRAAVGLSSVQVPVGGVHVQLAGNGTENIEERSLSAAELLSAFWSEVATLMHSTQQEWATSLVLFPKYDAEFEAFVDICDNIVEPTVVATRATDFIGRAWFHPNYNADLVGHSDVIAGHAVPHKMVDKFVKSLHSSTSGQKNEQGLLEYDQMVMANNRVRQTPHATINILRRSQLLAAGEYEKGLGEKRPKANSIYARNAVRLAGAMANVIDK